jgi:hypothetical protein
LIGFSVSFKIEPIAIHPPGFLNECREHIIEVMPEHIYEAYKLIGYMIEPLQQQTWLKYKIVDVGILEPNSLEEYAAAIEDSMNSTLNSHIFKNNLYFIFEADNGLYHIYVTITRITNV